MPRRRNQQWRGRDNHPPYCSCVKCQRRRLGEWRRGATKSGRASSSLRSRSTNPRAAYSRSRGGVTRNRYPRRGRGFWHKARWLTVRLIVLAALVTAALVGYHAYIGAPIGPAIDMMTEDYRVAAACPTDPGIVFEFVRRLPYPDERSNMSSRYQEGWEGRVCSGDLAYQQPAENGEVTQPVQAAVPEVTEVPEPNAKATPTPAVRPAVKPTVRGSAATPTFNSEKSVTLASDTPTPTPIPTNTHTSPPVPPPPLRHLEEKQFMLELINDERVSAGLSPVVLGDNAAAQLHAEASLENCFSSHWGVDGLKPYMRYSLAGGYQSNGENGSGLDYCTKASDGYRALGNLERQIREAMAGWMTSQGHRKNILDPWHKKVNIGLAWDRFNFMAYQHFEGDYLEYDRLPIIDKGVLRIAGTLKNGAQFDNSLYSGVQVFYDQSPHTLSRGQVTRTYCYGFGRQAASLRPPLIGRSYYPTHEFTQTYQPCPDPYKVPASASPPKSHDEAHSVWQAVYLESLAREAQTITVPWITAEKWTVEGKHFSISADLSDVLAKHGDGVYSVVVWGSIEGEDTVISQYSIFHGVTPPDTYNVSKPEDGG